MKPAPRHLLQVGMALEWDVEQGAELSSVAGQGWVFKVVDSNTGQAVLTCGGFARRKATDRHIVEFPIERVRVFKIVPADATGEKTESQSKP